jgi:hypothetical protein
MMKRHPGIVVGALCLILLIAFGAVYRWRLTGDEGKPPPIPIPVAQTSPGGWKPVPLPPDQRHAQVSQLALDPELLVQRCGTWDRDETRHKDSRQEICLAEVAAEFDTQNIEGITVNRARWSDAASSLNVPSVPGPPPQQWVVLVRFEYREGTASTVVLDRDAGTPYLLIAFK